MTERRKPPGEILNDTVLQDSLLHLAQRYLKAGQTLREMIYGQPSMRLSREIKRLAAETTHRRLIFAEEGHSHLIDGWTDIVTRVYKTCSLWVADRRVVAHSPFHYHDLHYIDIQAYLTEAKIAPHQGIDMFPGPRWTEDERLFIQQQLRIKYAGQRGISVRVHPLGSYSLWLTGTRHNTQLFFYNSPTPPTTAARPSSR